MAKKGDTEGHREIGSRLQMILESIEKGIGIVAVAVVVVVAFLQVIARRVVGSSFPWAEEVCKFGIIWMTYGGAAYAFRVGANIGVTFLVDRLPKNAAKVLDILVQLVLIGCFVLLFILGADRMYDQIAKHQMSPAARLPMWIPWLSIPFGSALTIICLIQQLISKIRHTENKPVKKPKEVAGEEE